MLKIFFPFAVVLFLALLVPAAMLILARLLGPYRPSPRKNDSYECGLDTVTQTVRGRFSVKFFMVAMCFLIFDIEVVFLYPWAVQFSSLGLLGMVEMFVFIGVLVVGLIYIWKRGVLSWE